MDYHGPLRTLYYSLKKLNTLNYMDPAPLNTLLHPSTPYNTLKNVQSNWTLYPKKDTSAQRKRGPPCGNVSEPE